MPATLVLISGPAASALHASVVAYKAIPAATLAIDNYIAGTGIHVILSSPRTRDFAVGLINGATPVPPIPYNYYHISGISTSLTAIELISSH